MAFLAVHEGDQGHAYSSHNKVKYYYQSNWSFKEAIDYINATYGLMASNTHCLNKVPDIYDRIMAFNPYWALRKLQKEEEELKKEQENKIIKQ